jgi:hypothetical protein
MRWLCILLAIGSWVGCAFLADAKMAAPVVIFLSALGWFFIMIAIGGKKGLPFGIAIFVFVGCIFLFWWSFSALLNPSPKATFDAIAYLALIPASLLAFATPVFIGKKVWKIVTKKKTKKEVSYGSRKIHKMVRGRIGIR